MKIGCAGQASHEARRPKTISLVIRFRNMEDIPGLTKLGYDVTQLRDFAMGVNNLGFTLFMGKTNSGKSTSQAAYMKKRSKDVKNLEISTETELMFDHFVQLVLPNQGPEDKLPLWRERMIKVSTRHDVDFLAVNEINSKETASMVSTLMMQGSSGVSSAHGAGWGAMINRLKSEKDLGISEDILFSESFFNLLIYQTLVGTLCRHCSLTEHPIDAWNKQMKRWFPDDHRKFRYENKEGCEHCEINGKKLGITGRTLVAEVIPITQENRYLLRNTKDTQPMREWLHATGRLNIQQHAFLKSVRGQIDPVKIQGQIGTFSKYNLFEKINDKTDVEKEELRKRMLEGAELNYAEGDTVTLC